MALRLASGSSLFIFFNDSHFKIIYIDDGFCFTPMTVKKKIFHFRRLLQLYACFLPAFRASDPSYFFCHIPMIIKSLNLLAFDNNLQPLHADVHFHGIVDIG